MDRDPLLANRRGAERERVAFTAVVWPALDESLTHSASVAPGFRVAVIDNLSVSGLCFHSHTAYAMDIVLWIRVRMGSKTCQFKGVVTRSCTAARTGRRYYTCGVEFVRSSQTSHAQAVVAGYLTTVRHKTHPHLSHPR
jgi:hypothetical protein